MKSANHVAIIKVGGSLFDWPLLAKRLREFVADIKRPCPVLIAGGGSAVHVVEALGQTHGLSEDASHWLAIRAMRLNGNCLAHLLSGSADLTCDLDGCRRMWQRSILPVMDPLAFAETDDGMPGRLAHSWSVTSDAISARLAEVWGARELWFLKSIGLKSKTTLSEAVLAGAIDRTAPTIIERIVSAGTPLSVHFVDLRAWQPGQRGVQLLAERHEPDQ